MKYTHGADCRDQLRIVGTIWPKDSDGVERLTRIKSSGRNLGAINDSEVDHEEERFSVPDLLNPKVSLCLKRGKGDM